MFARGPERWVCDTVEREGKLSDEQVGTESLGLASLSITRWNGDLCYADPSADLDFE